MKQLSKTAAIRDSRGCVSVVKCGRRDYVIVGPYRYDDLTGPSTERRTTDAWESRRIATLWRTHCAAALLGLDTVTTSHAIDRAAYCDGINDIRSLVDRAIEANKRARA